MKSNPPDWEALKQEVKAAASRLGIDAIGFASADPFIDLKEILRSRREAGYESGFEERDLDLRTEPARSLDDARSLISIAVAYPSKLERPPKSEPGAYRGILARSSWGTDYHLVLKDRLERLEAFLRERVPDARMVSMVDTGALVDRAVAERAGVGFIGKNCSIITPEFGSWVYLGEMITNLPFPPDTPLLSQCGECTRCIDACPTGALIGPGQLNAQRCVSYQTQTKGLIEDEFKEAIGNRLYGCDSCQTACPINKGLNWKIHSELAPDPDTVKPLLLPLLAMSNKEFKAKYGQVAAAWRGKKPIQRNAILALGHFRDRSALPVLCGLLADDPRPEIRGTAAWALGRIGGEQAEAALNDAVQREQDEAVLNELQKAVYNLQKNHVTIDKKRKDVE